MEIFRQISCSKRNMPSTALMDRCHTMLARGFVRYLCWERCTSRMEEVSEEPEIKGLRLTSEGNLVQDVEKDKTTTVNGELLWQFALRRRAVAGEIAGLISYDAMDAWHSYLTEMLLRTPPPGHKKVSWAQLLAADKALFQYVANKCQRGRGANHRL